MTGFSLLRVRNENDRRTAMHRTVSEILIFALCVGVGLTLAARDDDTRVACRDEEGQVVDWYYMYKLPKHFDGNSESDKSGLLYMFVTDRHPNVWQLSSQRINESTSMPARTLQPLFDNDELLLMAYNDEYPDGTFVPTGGHTKGVVATDGRSGVWLVHSVPKFPTIPQYDYPPTGAHYAQSFLCLSLPGEEMHKVGEQLIYNEPNVYFSRIPAMLRGRFATLEKVIQQQWRTEPPFSNSLSLRTYEGTEFKSFAKSGRFEQELYEDWLAPELGANFLVETWRNGEGNLPSNCSSQYKVYNIEEISSQPLRLTFKTSNDHAKWAVSQAQERSYKLSKWRLWRQSTVNDWICVGDINRQQHQLKRGGGTVCQNNEQIAQLYRQLVQDFEPCTPPSKAKKTSVFLFWS